MSVKFTFLLIGFLMFSLFLPDLIIFRKEESKTENHAPHVKILKPKDKDQYQWDTPVKYSISVADAEDGDTKFQEIESNEVLLCVRYLSDSSKIIEVLNDESKSSPGLDEIRKSNCLNCHAFSGTLIGPSFQEVSRRYPDSQVNRTKLAANIINGLSGVWGSAVMPTHPELSKKKASLMVGWILSNAADSTVGYFRGTDGSFRIKAPSVSSQKGILLITASYIDHGLKDGVDTNLKGADRVVLEIR